MCSIYLDREMLEIFLDRCSKFSKKKVKESLIIFSNKPNEPQLYGHKLYGQLYVVV